MMKKTLALWQMIVMAALLLAVTVTIFFPPLFVVDGEKAASASIAMCEDIVDDLRGEEDDDWLDDLWEDLQDTEEVKEKKEEIAEEMDEKVEEFEEESGFSISSISAWDLLTTSIAGRLEDVEDEMDEEDRDAVDDFLSGLTWMRVLMWIVYIGAFLLMVFVILSFLFKINKYVVTVIGTVYGVLGSILYALYYWWLPGRLTDAAGDAVSDLDFGMDIDSDVVTDYVSSFMKDAFWGKGFLITFLFLAALAAVSVLFLFIGQSRQMFGYGPEPGFPMTPPGPGPVPVMPVRSPDPVPVSPGDRISPPVGGPAVGALPIGEPPMGGGAPFPSAFSPAGLPEMTEERARQNKPMGRVQCIAGEARGKGYRLPEENKIVVGKDPGRCSLVINDRYVSGVHCSIRYNAAANTYRVQDYSSNGTMVGGVRMPKGAPVEYPAGTVLALADGKNQIKLG